MPLTPPSPLRQLLQRLLLPLAAQEPSFYRAVLASFGLAATLWMLRALGRSYTAPLDYPVRWHYEVARYHPARALPATLPIEVRGTGWRLLTRTLGFHLLPAEVRLRLPGTPPLDRSAMRPPLRRALGTVRLVSLPPDSASYYLVPGAQ